MQKKGKLPLMVLFLVMGGMCFSGCDKNKEEDSLGASRPIPNMLTDLSDGKTGLYTTEWFGDIAAFTLTITFDRTECTFIFTETKTGNKTITKYTYQFAYPTVTLTPEKETERVIIGTVVSGRQLAADEISFVDEQNISAWMRVYRKK
ncbi:MAG TPA: hypothetical protein PLI30_09685 [Petrimonas sp.]|nr:hypothetical protein [Petrimonas sp.]